MKLNEYSSNPQEKTKTPARGAAVRSTAFVVGATGYTGREVVHLLVRQGLPVVAHVRSDSSRLEEWRNRFGKAGATVDATPWEEAALAERLRELNPGTVFACLGTTRHRAKGEPNASFESVDYGLTAMLIRACQTAGIRPRFVYLSSTGVKEGATKGYFGARARAEAELRESGLPYIIARPSFIIGRDRDDHRPAEYYGAKALDVVLNLLGAIGLSRFAERYKSTTNTHLAQALVRYALDPEAENRTLESEELH